MGVLFGSIVGQLAIWPLGWTGVIVIALCSALLEFLRLPLVGIRAGMLISCASALSFWGTLADVPGGEDLSLPILIDEIPRYPKVGLMTFVGHLQGSPWAGQKVFVRAIHLPWRNSSKLQQGTLVWMRGECHPPEYTSNPFTYESWQRRQGIALVCESSYLTAPIAESPSIRAVVREAVVQHTYQSAGEVEGNGLFLAMTFGFRDQLSEQTERVFKSLGLTHLLVVSGYQISLIFGVILVCCSRTLMWLRLFACPRNVAVLPALIAAGLYVWLCGSDTATMRAFLAGICIALQYWIEHRVSFLHRIVLALFGITLIFPFAWLDLGVQFTTAALLGIGSGLYLSRGNTPFRRCISVSLHVWLMTSIVMVMWFGSFTLISLPINLLVATPWSSLNCTVGALALVMSYLPLPWSSMPLYLVGVVNGVAVGALSYIEYYTRGMILILDEPYQRLIIISLLLGAFIILWRRSLLELVYTGAKSAEIVVRTTHGR